VWWRATTVLRGNGFLAVYLAGIVMGNSEFIHRRSLARFHDGLAWIAQIAMFLTLGLLVFPSQLVPLAGVALLMSAAPDMWRLIGDRTLLVLVVFAVGGLVVGHLLGGSDRRDAAMLGFATSCRHPATALTLISANFPNTDAHAAVALYGLVTAVAGGLYTVWFRRTRVADS
jgi:hypothetical protein